MFISPTHGSQMEKPLFASIPENDYARLKQLARANGMTLKAAIIMLIRAAKPQ